VLDPTAGEGGTKAELVLHRAAAITTDEKRTIAPTRLAVICELYEELPRGNLEVCKVELEMWIDAMRL
jgi:hypothetical protein